MKRQIFTALSLTLLISSPFTLNAGKRRSRKLQSAASDVPHASSSFAPNVASPATLDLAPVAPTDEDEFDPSNTAPQRAALFAAIVALGYQNNKGLRQIDSFPELERERVRKNLYMSEDAHTNITPKSAQTQTIATDAAAQPADLPLTQKFAVRYAIAQWRLYITKKKLAKTQEELHALRGQQTLVLFPSSPTPSNADAGDDIAALFNGSQTLQLEHDFETVPVPSSSSSSSSSSSTPSQTPAPTPVPATSSVFGWLFGRK